MLFLFAYGLCTLGAAIMAFLLPPSLLRIAVRIGAVLLAIPVVIVVGLRWFIFGPEPPTLSELKQDFPARHADLETLVSMAEEDREFRSIQPWGTTPKAPPEFGPRFAKYAVIFKRSGIELGIERYDDEVSVTIRSVGILNRGHASGYVFCRSAQPNHKANFYPCIFGKDRGFQPYQRDTRTEAYSYERIDAHWFVMDVGPS